MMPHELEIGGVMMPGLFPIFIGCLLLMVLIDLVIGHLGLYRHVWNPALFRFALFVCLFGVAGLLFIR